MACENGSSFGYHETDENVEILNVEGGRSNCEYSVLDICRDLAAAETKISFVLIRANGRSESNGGGGSAIFVVDARDDFCQRRITRPVFQVGGNFDGERTSDSRALIKDKGQVVVG